MKRLSIIIPIYNNQSTIRRCLSSILKYNDLYEVILVDDGSTDESFSICKSFSHNSIKLYSISHQGVSNARNYGIKKATGDLITFVDADDEIENNFSPLSQTLSIESDYYLFPIKKESKIAFYQKEGLFFIKDVRKEIKSIILNEQINYVTAKIYKAKIIKKYHLSFDSKSSIAEDLLFNLQYINHCTTLYFSNDCFYHHWQNELSITKRYLPEKYQQLMNANKKIFKELDVLQFSEVKDFLLMKNLYSSLSNLEKKDCSLDKAKKKKQIKQIKAERKGKILFAFGFAMFLWSTIYTIFPTPVILFVVKIRRMLYGK